MKDDISEKPITAIPESLLCSKVWWASGLLLLLPRLAKNPMNRLFCSTLLLSCSLIFFLALGNFYKVLYEHLIKHVLRR